MEKEVFATKWYRGIVNGLQESFSFGYVMFYKLNLRICIRSIFLPFREEKLIKYSIYYSVTKVCVGIAYLIWWHIKLALPFKKLIHTRKLEHFYVYRQFWLMMMICSFISHSWSLTKALTQLHCGNIKTKLSNLNGCAICTSSRSQQNFASAMMSVSTHIQL